MKPVSLKYRKLATKYLFIYLFIYYRPRSRGDNMFGSVRVCARVCVSIRLSVGALLFEPFDYLGRP